MDKSLEEEWDEWRERERKDVEEEQWEGGMEKMRRNDVRREYNLGIKLRYMKMWDQKRNYKIIFPFSIVTNVFSFKLIILFKEI